MQDRGGLVFLKRSGGQSSKQSSRWKYFPAMHPVQTVLLVHSAQLALQLSQA